MALLLPEIFRLLQTGNIPAARQAINRLLVETPSSAEAHDLLGMLETQTGNPGGAVASFLKAIALGGARADRSHNLALAYEQSGDLTSAEHYYREALRQDAKQSSAGHNLAALLVKQQRLEEALAIAQAAFNAAPQNSKLRIGLSDILARLQQTDAALATLGDTPESDELQIAKLRLLRETGRTAAALQLVDRLLQRQVSPALLTSIGHTLFQAGKYQPAHQAFVAVAESVPKQFDAWLNRSITAIYVNKLPDAELAARQAIALKPQAAMAHVCLANALSRRSTSEKMQEAEKEAILATTLAPDLAAAWRSLGQVKYKKGEFPAAREALTRAVQLAPADYDSNLSLADCCEIVGEFDAAENILTRLTQHTPTRADAPRQLGIVKLKRRQDQEALRQLDTATRLDPTDQRAHAHHLFAQHYLNRLSSAQLQQEYATLAIACQLPPPSGFDDIAQFNAAFRSELLNHAKLRWEPSGLAARNGYLSEDLLNPPSSLVDAFLTACMAQIESHQKKLSPQTGHPFLGMQHRTSRAHMWAVVLESAGTVDSHIHEASWLSCVYYVQVPDSIRADDPDCQGWLEFGMPPAALRRASHHYPVHRLCPKPGMLVMFPSYFYLISVDPHH
ncbi:MAG: tetratricopeptide repeat protein [Pseudomonadota bacterium]